MNKNARTPRLSVVLLVVASLASGCAHVSQNVDHTARLRILHWNDFHAHYMPYDVTATDGAAGNRETYKVGGAGNFVAYLKHYRAEATDVAVLNAGDNFQGTPISSITKGHSEIELLNLINPDAVALGNHEFDYGLENLREKIALARFPLLAANVYDSTTGKTLVPSTLVKQFGRTKIGIIGFLPPDLPILTLKGNLAGTRMLDIDSVVSIQIKQLKEKDKVDLIVLLSHMGVEADTMLALRHNDIDVIVGGHTHLALQEPIKKNRTIVVQAGQWGQYLGELDLVVDLVGDSVISYDGRLIETRLGVYGEDSAAAAMASRFEGLVDKELNEVIGTLAVDWKRSFTSESNIGNWQADVMRDYAGTDIGLANSGTIRENLPAGPITRRNIWQINPFNNTFVTFSVTGKQLWAMVEWQAEKKGELMQVSGLRYTYDSRNEFGKKVQQVTVGRKPVEMDKRYSIATNNYVAGHLGALLGLEDESIRLTDLDVLARDILIDYIIRQRTVTSSIEGRIVDLASSGGSPK